MDGRAAEWNLKHYTANAKEGTTKITYIFQIYPLIHNMHMASVDSVQDQTKETYSRRNACFLVNQPGDKPIKIQNTSSIYMIIWALPEASSIMRALSGARCTDVRLYTLWIKIGTNQRALGERSHYWTRLCWIEYSTTNKFTPDRRQSKTLIQSRNVDQK